ncbi:hypothetical protein M9458_042422, partial [Cirrhinus mrigala]
GRYRWRHDKVLAVLADILEKERGKRRPAKVRPLLSTIAFVKEGQRPIVHSQARQNLLQSAQGWEMEVDLGRRLHFPEAVLSTTLRPDIIMWSLEGKRIILVELTVPWEEDCEEAAERKNGKYQQLVQDCRDKGIPSPICVESDDKGWTERPLEESSHSESLLGHKLEAWWRGAVTWPVTADPPTGGLETT